VLQKWKCEYIIMPLNKNGTNIRYYLKNGI